MRKLQFLSFLTGFLFLLSCSSDELKKPNIIFILADDLGYGDLGCYGSEKIETPNIDMLAESGMVFTDHYSGSPVCAPSRCVLLTGKHSGHAYIRGNDEWGDRGDVWDYRAMIADSILEGQRPMPADVITIGKILQSQGYATGMTGKWGLGAPHTESIPTTQGFDFFCGYNCQRQAHTYYPVHLYLNENRIALGNDTLAPHSKLPAGMDPMDAESYSGFSLNSYAPDVMFAEMIRFLDRDREGPFFLYWASPIPHAPLQAPRRWVEYYLEKFGEEAPYQGDQGYFPTTCPHATYAAMISFLDEQIGKLVEKLKQDGLFENTLIMFTSDNGPTFNGGTDSPWFNSGGPFNEEKGRGKGYLYEGGIRVPLIASWPGKISAGSSSGHISCFQDLLPTFCEITGAALPEEMDGISYLQELLGSDQQEEHPYLYWEFPAYGGQQAVRMGPWKGIRAGIMEGNLDIELYNLDEDLLEEKDLAAEHPELIRQIEAVMSNEHQPSELERFRMEALGDGKW